MGERKTKYIYIYFKILVATELRI